MLTQAHRAVCKTEQHKDPIRKCILEQCLCTKTSYYANKDFDVNKGSQSDFKIGKTSPAIQFVNHQLVLGDVFLLAEFFTLELLGFTKEKAAAGCVGLSFFRALPPNKHQACST